MRKAFLVMAALTLLCLSGVAQADVFNLGGTIKSLEFVTIGDAGNADHTTGYGGVAYEYGIGKYEVTSAQYAEFLNAKAQTDTYGLYNVSMFDDYHGCKIQRTGESGSYVYTVASAYANRAVNFIGPTEAMRFVNWLENGQGNGDTEYGVYDMTQAAPTRIAGSTYAMQSMDEYYKAAYYKNGAYSFYSNGTSTAPTKAEENWGNPSVWNVGSGAMEQNGTYDLTGNVWDWTDTIAALNGSSSTYRMHGGNYATGFDAMQNTYIQAESMTSNRKYFGFRVTTSDVPEPGTMVALAGGLVGLLGLRRRRS